MKTMIDVYALLKRFGTIIYTGNRIGDIDLMEDEVKELYQTKMIDVAQFQAAMIILRAERTNLLQQK